MLLILLLLLCVGVPDCWVRHDQTIEERLLDWYTDCSERTLTQSRNTETWSSVSRGGDLERAGGTVPQNLRDGPSPDTLRSSVDGCARKYEQSKKRCHKGILFWSSGFSCEERVIYDIEHSKETENLGKERENPKNLVDDLKKVIRNFCRKNGNFVPKKRHSEILVREKNFRPAKLGARSPPLSVSRYGPCCHRVS